MKETKVIIIGAGSAGLQTAIELGERNIPTIIIDSKKDLLNLSFYTLGSFLDRKEFGLSEKIISSKITTAETHSKHFKSSHKGNAFILDKRQLHKELITKINKLKSVRIIKGTRITSYEKENTGELISVKGSDNKTYKAKIFVDATGSRGLLSKPFGLQDKQPKLAVGLEYNVKYKGDSNKAIFYIGSDYAGGYGWLFPLKGERAILGFGSFHAGLIKNLKPALDRLLEHKTLRDVVKKDNNETQGGNIPITEVKTKFVKGNLVCVGDSVGQVNPLVGEGYRFMLQSGRFAGAAIANALKSRDITLLNEYEKNWKEKYLASYNLAKTAQRGLDFFTKSDILTDIIVFGVKFKSNKRMERIYSGEFSLSDVLLP